MQKMLWSWHRHSVIVGLIALAPLLTVLGDQESEDMEAGDSYPLAKCALRNSVLDEKAEVIDDDGREIRVCCEDCLDEFSQGRDAWVATIDEKLIEQQEDFYPLTKCVVDGKPGDGFGLLDVVFRNRMFRVCNEECQEKLAKTPAKYFDRLNKVVIKQQKPEYPLTRCIVSGKPLGKETIDHVVANQLVRLKDSKQLERFDQTPGKYLEDLRRAATKKDDK